VSPGTCQQSVKKCVVKVSNIFGFSIFSR